MGKWDGTERDVCFVKDNIGCVEMPFDMETADCLLLKLKLTNKRINLASLYRLQCLYEHGFVNERQTKIKQQTNKLNSTLYI